MTEPTPIQSAADKAAAAAKDAKLAFKAQLRTRPRWQKIFGVYRGKGRFIKWSLTRWGKAAVFLLVMLTAMAALGEYSMTPNFCRSCHLMEPYYQAWHDSKHKNVPCVDCHFEPGLGPTLWGKFQASAQAVKYITQTYGSKPHAEIRDVSCQRSGCHSDRVLKGKVTWKVPRVDEATGRAREITVRFDHTPHLTEPGKHRDKQLRCTSCHSQMVQGKHIVVTTDTCFLCHFKGVQHGRDDKTVGTCHGCHEAPKAKIQLTQVNTFDHADYAGKGVLCQNCHADTVRGDGSVPRQVCWNCHNQVPQINQYGETVKMHKAHVTEHKVECVVCHVPIEHALLANAREEKIPHAKLNMDAGTCNLCHEDMHLGPREMFQGVGGRLRDPATRNIATAKALPDPMARSRVNCIACHTAKKLDGSISDFKGQTFVATQERCDYCHKDKYKGKLDERKAELAKLLAETETAFKSATVAMEKTTLPPDKKLEAQRYLDNASYNIRFVKYARGMHNFAYATQLLSDAKLWSLDCTQLASGVASK